MEQLVLFGHLSNSVWFLQHGGVKDCLHGASELQTHVPQKGAREPERISTKCTT